MALDKKFLQRSIRKNMKEWKMGRWKSQKQALYMSYTEAREHQHKKRSRSAKKGWRNRRSKNKK